MDPAISVKGVTKRFGSTIALDSVSLDFRGRVNLVLGTNGSGKSTLINVMSGVTYPERGTLVLDNEELSAGRKGAWRKKIEAARVRMGFMLDRPGYPAYLDGSEFLLWASSGENGEWVRNLAQRLGMDAFVDKTIGGYSSGMAQKLGLASSLVSKPELVLWDEPTANLDASTRKIVASIIEGLVKDGTTFVIASHTPQDFEGIADWMCVMQLGRVVMSGMIKDLSVGSASLVIETERPSQIAAKMLETKLAIKAEVREGQVELEMSDIVDVQAVQELARSIQVTVRSIEARPKSVNELYAQSIAS